MFEAQILLCNVLLPCLVSLLSIAATRFAIQNPTASPEQGDANSPSETSRPSATRAATWIGASCGFLAVGLALVLRNGFSWWPEDAWLRIVPASALVAMVAIVSCYLPPAPQWISRFVVVSVAAWMVFPTGEGWEFLQPSQPYWLAALVLSTVGGWWALQRLPAECAGFLSLGWIPCAVVAAFLTSQSFMKVTEPLLAVSSVWGCLGIASLARRYHPTLAAAAGPSLFAYGAAAAQAQFHSFLGLPDSLTYVTILLPALAGGLSYAVLGRRSDDGTHIAWRAIPVAICLVLASILLAWVLMETGGSGDEW